MSPRRLDPSVVGARLREIQMLLDDLSDVGEVDAERLRTSRPTRHIVERVLSQIVELAGSINSHVVAARLGRAPAGYASSFDDVAEVGALTRELATALRPSAGLRNVLVHDYLDVDHSVVAASVPLTVEQYGEYVRQVSRWLTDRVGDES